MDEPSAFIPFVTNDDDDLRTLHDYHADSGVVHVPLLVAESVARSLRTGAGIWVDPEVDRYHHLLKILSGTHGRKWKGDVWTFPPDLPKLPGSPSKEFQDPWPWWTQITTYLKRFRHHSQLADPGLFPAPSMAAKRKLNDFVADVMNKCAQVSPEWITIPQLPLTPGTERNAVNKTLCAAASRWRSSASTDSLLILPVVFSKSGQYDKKAERTKRINTIVAWHRSTEFHGVWIADSTLSDQAGGHIFRDRFPALVGFHEELSEKLPANVFQVAGPYWGMNLVLWARGKVQFPAIGLGRGYQYFIPGAQVRRGKLRLPLPPLKRWAEVSGETETSKTLKDWLTKALKTLSRDDSAYKQLRELHASYDKLTNDVAARGELAKFYSRWCAELQAAPPAGRAFTLWQALSSAYVLGKQLPRLPEGGTSGDPARVPKLLMDCCL